MAGVPSALPADGGGDARAQPASALEHLPTTTINVVTKSRRKA
jgi:hypothetical protein